MPRRVAIVDELPVHLAKLAVQIKDQILGHFIEQIGCLLVAPNDVVDNSFGAQKFDISTVIDDIVHERNKRSDVSASEDVATLEGYEIQKR